jgi:hypothetical protein
VMCGIGSWATCGPARSAETSVSEEYDDSHTHADGRRSDSCSKNDTQCSYSSGLVYGVCVQI